MKTATAQEREDYDTLTDGNKRIYVMALRRLRHHKQLNDEVIDTYLSQICTQDTGTKSSCIQSLYTERIMDDDFNYISDLQTIIQLSRKNIFESDMVFLPIGRNGHWSLATADLRTRNIYHDDSLRGTHGTRNRNGATLLKDMLTDLENHLGINNDKSSWICHNSVDTQAPQQTGSNT